MSKKLKRVFTSLKPSSTPSPSPSPSSSSTATPEATLTHHITLFCSASTPSGTEVAYLPTIVELVEAMPSCSAVAARQLRKSLSLSSAPQTQYNAIMLLRILGENPGASFTRHVGSDPKFCGAVRELVRKGRDPGVWGILRETLVHWSGSEDEGLAAVVQMWERERELIDAAVKKRGGSAAVVGGQAAGQAGAQTPLSRIPGAVELASRIAEANSSAKLLEQVVQSTVAEEVRGNELVREFVERCRLAERSLKGYITAGEQEEIEVETLATMIDAHEAVQRSLRAYKEKCPPRERIVEQPVPISPVSPVEGGSPVSALEAAAVQRQGHGGVPNIGMPVRKPVGSGTA